MTSLHQYERKIQSFTGDFAIFGDAEMNCISLIQAFLDIFVKKLINRFIMEKEKNKICNKKPKNGVSVF